jgi:hypothetical protein
MSMSKLMIIRPRVDFYTFLLVVQKYMKSLLHPTSIKYTNSLG